MSEKADQGEPRKRYLFERIGIYAVFIAILAITSSIIILLPYDDTYIMESGAPRAFLDAFVALAVVSTIVLIAGLFYNAMVWMEGGLAGIDADLPKSKKFAISINRFARAVFNRNFGKQTKEFIIDSILLTKLWKTSRARTVIHALIMFGFIGIFVLDIITTIALDVFRAGSFIDPLGWGTLWVRGFGFEIFGAMLLIGLAAASIRRFVVRPKQLKTEWEDVTSILFLFAVVLSGFIVEGVAMSSGFHEQSPSGYSFIGAAFSSLLPSLSVQSYAQVWFAHAVISLAFIAYIPFSKLFHIFAAPMAIHIEGIMKKEGEH